MIVRIDVGSPVPPYEQLRSQVAASITSGQLTPRHQLPPIRQLAADLDLAPGTVARAYRELEAAGLVVSRGRRGTRVSDAPPSVDATQVADLLAAAARSYATTTRQLGIEPDAAVTAIRVALDEVAAPAARDQDGAPAAPRGTSSTS